MPVIPIAFTSIDNYTEALESVTAITVDSGNLTLTAGNLVLSAATGSDGQIPIAASAGYQAWGSLTSTGGTITVTPGPNTLNIETTVVTGTVVETLTGNTGGAIPADSSHNINIVGSGAIEVQGAGNTLTIVNTATGGGLIWSTATGNTAMAVNHGYVNNNALGQTTFTLPSTASVGDTIAILGYSADGWTIIENTGQSIILGEQTTTVTTGAITSIFGSDGLYLVCIIPNTTFYVIPLQGNVIVS
jgi:hypothetical protein